MKTVTTLPTDIDPAARLRANLEQRVALKAFELMQAIKNGVLELSPDMTPAHRREAVRERFGGVSSMTLWRWVQGGILPAPIKINTRNYWTEADVNRVAADSLRDREAA